MSPASVGFSILGLFGVGKPGGASESSMEGEPLLKEAACSAAKEAKMEESTCSGDDKDASLSAIAAAVFLDSSPAAIAVAESEVAGCGS
jgi:hypothetical protein